MDLPKLQFLYNTNLNQDQYLQLIGTLFNYIEFQGANDFPTFMFLNRTKANIREHFGLIYRNLDVTPECLKTVCSYICDAPNIKLNRPITDRVTQLINEKENFLDWLNEHFPQSDKDQTLTSQFLSYIRDISWVAEHFCYKHRLAKQVAYSHDLLLVNLDEVQSGLVKYQLNYEGVGREQVIIAAKELVKYRDELWKALKEFFSLNGKKIEKSCLRIKHIHHLLDVDNEVEDIQWILDIAQGDPVQWEIIFSRPPSNLHSPVQFKGLVDTFREVNNLLLSAGKLKEDAKDDSLSKFNVLKEQVKEALDRTKPDDIKSIQGCRHALENLKEQLRNVNQFRLSHSEYHFPVDLKHNLNAREATLVEKLSKLEETGRLSTAQQRQSLAVSSQLLKPVDLPKLTSCLVFADRWLPSFDLLKSTGAPHLHLKLLVTQSLVKSEDIYYASQPTTSLSDLIKRLFKKYADPNFLLPELRRILSDLERPKYYDDSVKNIEKVLLVNKHLEKLNREDVIDENQLLRLPPLVMTKYNLMTYIKDCEKEPDFVDRHLTAIPDSTDGLSLTLESLG